MHENRIPGLRAGHSIIDTTFNIGDTADHEQLYLLFNDGAVLLLQRGIYTPQCLFCYFETPAEFENFLGYDRRHTVYPFRPESTRKWWERVKSMFS